MLEISFSKMFINSKNGHTIEMKFMFNQTYEINTKHGENSNVGVVAVVVVMEL